MFSAISQLLTRGYLIEKWATMLAVDSLLKICYNQNLNTLGPAFDVGNIYLKLFVWKGMFRWVRHLKAIGYECHQS